MLYDVIMTSHIPFFFKQLIRTNGWVVKACRRLTGDMGSIRTWCWIVLQHSCHFSWQVCALTHFLYCCALNNFFSWILPVVIWHWQGFTLNMNIRLPLFWSTFSPARGKDSATCVGLAHGRDYSYCRASELKLQKFLATVFPWTVENTWKTMATVRVSNPHPTDCVWPAQAVRALPQELGHWFCSQNLRLSPRIALVSDCQMTGTGLQGLKLGLKLEICSLTNHDGL